MTRWKNKLPATSELEALSEIIKELNERFGTEFSEEDRLVIHQIEQKLAQDERLGQTVRVVRFSDGHRGGDVLVERGRLGIDLGNQEEDCPPAGAARMEFNSGAPCWSRFYDK